MKRILCVLFLTGWLVPVGANACEYEEDIQKTMQELRTDTEALAASITLDENRTLKAQARILTSRIRRVERTAAIGIPEWYPFGSCRAYLPMLDQVERLYLNMRKFYKEEANKEISLILHWSDMEMSWAAAREVMVLVGCAKDDHCAPEG